MNLLAKKTIQPTPKPPSEPVETSKPVETAFKAGNIDLTGMVDRSQEHVEAVTPGQTGSEDYRSLKLANDNSAGQVLSYGEAPQKQETVMSQEDFIEFWGFDVWSIAAVPASMLSGKDLSGLVTTDEQRPVAENAMRALYKRACESKYLRWMTASGTSTMADIMVMGQFAGLKVGAVMAALEEPPEPPEPEATEHQQEDSNVVEGVFGE